ncbi:hypothetical protein H6F43_12070 [Leptolyngbya sp. FACHB-36]|uniref:hypothetical protein n=1 Tax=Leptolyngbya sp. FACHB-36 TaxID=2692808 RepID=UPI0016801F88|nr:hypothetical protein [Leptolyngbya sp. FACHB-36]MBD2020915.1 hypothetical protein [Leptolyngbya sp. FACHB-36]
MKQPNLANFQPCQIVCLEHETSRLYAEVVQVVDDRQVCWVRPFALAIPSSTEDDVLGAWIDLRGGADLLCPIVLFRSALDTEVLPLLTALYASSGDEDEVTDRAKRQQLNQFMRLVWQTHRQAFQAL